MMKLQKFEKLFNKILFENTEENTNITIPYKTFDYHFQTDDTKTYCFFNSIDKVDNKLISIKATIFENNQYEFLVTKNDNTKKTYTDKEFMLAYYKEYQDFKHVLSEYNKEKEEQKANIENIPDTEIADGKSIPKIINFNDALSQEQDIEDGILIRTNGIGFTIKQVEDKKYKNLITISFEFQNENPLKKETDLLNYDVIGLVKLTPDYIKILKLNLYNPDDLKSTDPVLVMTDSEFKQKFLTIYFVLKETLSNYFKQVKLENQF